MLSGHNDMKSRVLLADDHKVFRSAIRGMLERDPGVEVIGEAADGIEALELVRSAHPDVVVMDIRMPRLTGVEAIRELVRAEPSVKVIILSLNS
jgi:DNA-binding NarL/FixJ family response regulator